MRLSALGKVRLVISFETADLTGTYAVWITHRVDWTAHRIVATYLLRWPMEAFYQEGKVPLGLDEDRMRGRRSPASRKTLVSGVRSLLALALGLPAPSLNKSRLPIKTIGEACWQQAQALIEALSLQTHERLPQGQNAKDVFAHLFAKQQVIAMV